MKLLVFGLSLIAMLLGAAAALAQEAYPTQPITIVVPFPPGGGPDTRARWVGQELSERLGQPVIIENRPGASGALGAEYVARARPDGYTLLVSNMQATTVMPSLMKLNYNPVTDFTPISKLARIFHQGRGSCADAGGMRIGREGRRWEFAQRRCAPPQPDAPTSAAVERSRMPEGIREHLRPSPRPLAPRKPA